ncbi:MAG TPA: RNB domain-containing ribonuclease [Candidatus Acidoferrales bacterium]|nr:RNB domain-containing ribonuclease [Candidatus Acidoferrales bacterium]
MTQGAFDLAAAAHQEMTEHGFEPEFPAEAERQLASIQPRLAEGLRDLTSLLWSSIDNDESRDLDQIEWAERVAGGIRVLVGIADVDSLVARSTPIDAHAARETTTVYAGVRNFPMLPERLSTDLTSLSEGQDRDAIVIEMLVGADGAIASSSIYQALVRNRAQLTYSAVGPWLEGTLEETLEGTPGGTGAPPPKVAASAGLAAQLKLQDEAAHALREARHRLGALTFDRAEVQPVMANGQVRDIEARRANRASRLIEDFMIGANEVMARTLRDAGVSSIRRVVKAPERWARIVELAERYHDKLPPEPDAAALDGFLMRRKQADAAHYADVSLAVLKLMGPGEYVASRPGDTGQGHFGLAAHDYTHSTAPNRRFADLVTQRLLKALEAKAPQPYTDDELDDIARNCTLKEDAARKVQRDMTKRIAAVALQHRVGQAFDAVVTGVTPKGVFVRIVDPPVEGRLMHGEQGVDVGDRLHVTLLGADPQRGFIDFGR